MFSQISPQCGMCFNIMGFIIKVAHMSEKKKKYRFCATRTLLTYKRKKEYIHVFYLLLALQMSWAYWFLNFVSCFVPACILMYTWACRVWTHCYCAVLSYWMCTVLDVTPCLCKCKISLHIVPYKYNAVLYHYKRKWKLHPVELFVAFP